jgi:hypothetical protein
MAADPQVREEVWGTRTLPLPAANTNTEFAESPHDPRPERGFFYAPETSAVTYQK